MSDYPIFRKHEEIESIFATADSHSIFVFCDIINKHSKDVKNSIYISAGDEAEGFLPIKKDEKHLDKLHDNLKANNNFLYAIHGNHAQPIWFSLDHHFNKKYSNIKFLPDYSLLLINSQRFIFCGGAVSVDRVNRSVNIDWWPDEKFIYDEEKLNKIGQCDVAVFHSRPAYVSPIHLNDMVLGWAKYDKNLISELQEERELIGKAVAKLQPKLFISGHFHEYSDEFIGNIRYRGLEINEVWEIPPKYFLTNSQKQIKLIV